MKEQVIILVQEEPRGPSQLVEIPVGAVVTQRVNIPDQPQLRSMQGQTVIVKAVRLITDKVSPQAPTIGLVNATRDELRKMFLVIYCQGWEKAQYIPILVLNDMVDADSTEATTIPYRNRTTRFSDWPNVDWTKSYIQYANGTPSDGSAYAVLLEVEYVKLDGQNQEIIGPS
jgi:hypothetical protein